MATLQSPPAAILIVEDDPSVRILLSRLLSADGIAIDTAANADEARRIAGDRRPDVVITDVVMPGGSGLELRRDFAYQYPDLPVILISGYSSEHVAEFAARTPCTVFLPKPFATGELLDLVRAAIEGRAW